MKTYCYCKMIALYSVLFFGLLSCKKEPMSLNSQNQSLSSVQSENAQGNTLHLLLRPGPDDGQDAFVFQWDSDPEPANTNYNTLPELPIAAWTNGGLLHTTNRI